MDMSKQSSPKVPRLSHEQRVASAGQFERANQVLNTGNLEYGMQLLLNCCLFEKTGNFTAATALWEMVRKADPTDLEAQHKYKGLAASATIAKGRYEDAIQGAAPTPMVSGPGAADETAVQETAIEQTETNL